MSESIEQEIKDLERKLALKRAYLSVNISFGKGYKAFPEDVRKEVEENLLENARLLAESDNKKSVNNGNFTEEEILVLKQYAKVILNKTSTKPAAKTPKAVLKTVEEQVPVPNTINSLIERANPQVSKGDMPLMGELITLDSVPKTHRQNVLSGDTVQIVKIMNSENKYLVRDSKHNQFPVNIDDVQLLKGES